jgi:ABC-type Mn2+/Zn2+ transport system ATPase subunit
MWNADQGLCIGYKNRLVATVTEQILFEAGKITLMVGLNGQGKTTFMKTLAGSISPRAGSNNRAQMTQDLRTWNIWGPLGKN